MADLSRKPEWKSIQPARPDQREDHPRPRAEMDVHHPGRAARAADDADRRRRRDVRHVGERSVRARSAQRPSDLALQPPAHARAGRRRGQRDQSRRCGARRSRVHGHRQCAPDRPAPRHGRAAMGCRDGRLSPELRRHGRAARRQRSRDLRRVRRRRRHPGLSRRVPRLDRRARLAILDGACAG